MDIKEILVKLEDLADPKAIEGMARFGITKVERLGFLQPWLENLKKFQGNRWTCG